MIVIEQVNIKVLNISGGTLQAPYGKTLNKHVENHPW